MEDTWSYHRAKTYDKTGRRWHFVTHNFFPAAGEDEPREYYFRDDEGTEFGVLRFDSIKDNPYRDFAAIKAKIMLNAPFRRSLLDDSTRSVWRKHWK